MTTTAKFFDAPTGDRPEVGASAPDVTLPDDTAHMIRFADRWGAAPRGLVLVFIRHFG